jgi:hypothetical protein
VEGTETSRLVQDSRIKLNNATVFPIVNSNLSEAVDITQSSVKIYFEAKKRHRFSFRDALSFPAHPIAAGLIVPEPAGAAIAICHTQKLYTFLPRR